MWSMDLCYEYFTVINLLLCAAHEKFVRICLTLIDPATDLDLPKMKAPLGYRFTSTGDDAVAWIYFNHIVASCGGVSGDR